MPNKIDFSKKMGNLLRTFRLNNGKKSINLAKHINKSPAYINKLENGEIKKIDEKLLKEIVFFITDDKNGMDIFYKEYSNIITKEDYDREIAFMNYDYNSRMIPVSSALIEFINIKLLENSINGKKIISYINQNEDIANEDYIIESINNDEIEFNIWKKIPNQNEKGYYIYLNYDLNKYDDLLKSKQKKETYMFIYSFVYHLLKYETHLNNSKNDINKLKSNTISILNKYKFFSYETKFVYLNDDNSYSKIITKYDINYDNAVKSLIKNITLLSDRDILDSTNKLNIINENFIKAKSKSFVLDYMSINLEKTKLIDDKDAFFNDLQRFIDNYSLTNNSDDDF